MGNIEIFGFRSKKPVKMIIAGICYLFLFFYLATIISTAVAGVYPTSKDKEIAVLSSVIKFISFALPAFAINLKLNTSFLTNIKMPAVIIAAVLVSIMLISVVPSIEKGYSAEFLSIIEQKKQSILQ